MVTMLNDTGRGAERARNRWHVDIVVTRILRDRRQHTNHGMHLVIHPEMPADDVRIATMALLPVLVAQYEDRVGTHLVVSISKESS